MRFCPFCSAENVDDAASCASCSRRLPPLPPRRAGSKGPATGIIQPVPRASGNTTPPPLPQRKAGATVPPPLPAPATGVPEPAPISLSASWSVPVAVTSAPDTAPVNPPSAPVIAPTTIGSTDTTVVNRDSAPALPPPPVPSQQGASSGLLDALSPSPAALRREAPPLDQPIVGDRRGANPLPAAGNPAPGYPSAISPSAFTRTKTSSVPPPLPPVAATVSIVQPSPSPAPTPIDSRSSAVPDGVEPPPTRIHRPEALVDRPFTPAKVNTIPEIPEPGLIHAARYTYQFTVARWQRRGAIKQLGIEIKQDTEALDQVLGALGRAARVAKVEGRVFSAENNAISNAEERIAALQRDSSEVEGRKAEENSKFGDIERERNEKLVEAERMVEEAHRESQHLEAQRRSLRDKRKELDHRQKQFLRNAEAQEKQAGAAPLGDQRQDFRRAAEGLRKEAAVIEPDKQDLDRRITALERPLGEALARLDAAKAELDAAKRSLNDAREGHGHRLAELDAEQKRKAREVSLAEAEIQRRLVTLGTLVNLNRVEDPSFAELYHRIDRLRGAITARTTEIEKLTAEREAYDRGTWVRGLATIGGAFLALIAVIVILRAVL